MFNCWFQPGLYGRVLFCLHKKKGTSAKVPLTQTCLIEFTTDLHYTSIRDLVFSPACATNEIEDVRVTLLADGCLCLRLHLR